MLDPELEDYLGIHALYGRYNWAMDTANTDAMHALFLPEGSITQPGADGVTTARGSKAVRAVIAEWHADPAQRGRQHQITNLVVRPDDQGRDDHRSARTYLMVTDPDGGPPSTLVYCAFADDVVVRTPDGWRILDRRVGVWGPSAVDEFSAVGQS